jgi:rhodanese-related sulfurtransferase
MTPLLGLLALSALSAHAENDMDIIDAVQTERLLQSGAVFIDNRPEDKYALGHIEGAVNLPFLIAGDPANRMTRENLVQTVGDGKVVVFYCTGHQRAYHAMKQAEQWGVQAEMHWYKNGFSEWKKLQMPIAE